MIRTSITLAFAMLASLAAAPAWAQAWPTRPVHIIVGFPPGGMADALPRKMQEALAATLGQPVVVENRPGGAGSIAVLAVTQAKDNHTFGIVTLQNAALPALDPKTLYDIRKDLQGVVLMATVPNILAVTMSMPVKTRRGVSWRTPRPIRARCASRPAGNGTGAHFALENAEDRRGARHRPRAVQGRAGELRRRHRRSRRCNDRALCINASAPAGERIAAARGQHHHAEPARAETCRRWSRSPASRTSYSPTGNAVVAPSSMPEEYVAKMSRALLEIMKSQAVVDFTTTSGLQLNPLGAKATTEFIGSEYDRMVIVAKRTGIKM